ncbi:PREDICTED: kinesin-like protein KIF19 isoform X1 [Branchiostoma belcheri]|uniref:Kinesin-like protein KIN-8B n=1 Tax=Branchiostoma belcheri TaxID=7741 RepID=A0A6P5AGL5_BRABE|nr:PREDICTED: kinesin-like protein KIF19 isoform X1 [Branchiostoma belcheri]
MGEPQNARMKHDGAMKTEGGGQDHQLTVALRVRPVSDAELEQGATLIAHRVDNNNPHFIESICSTTGPGKRKLDNDPYRKMVVLMDPQEDPDDILRANRSREKQYVFDYSFDGRSSQEEVYAHTTRPLIESVIEGFNATVFAYGATGAGKTYTMLGTDHEPGVMARSLNDLFEGMYRTSENMVYQVSMSYLEIYNEMIRDLLSPESGYLELREDTKGVQVAGLSEVNAKSTKEVMELLQQGNKQRTQEPTKANKTSSRSHAVLQVTVKQRSRVRNTTQEVRVGKLYMIDLAGSERAAQTQNRGKRMKEGAHINRSLLALGNCINALCEKGPKAYVNYRDSKLTRLLKDALGGNCKTVMIAHISPASTSFDESRNTLLYADRAKNIKTRVKRNLMNVSYHIAQYTAIISDLRKEISRLKLKIEEQEMVKKELSQGQQLRSRIKEIQSEVQLEASKSDKKEMVRLREQLVSAFHEQMEIRRSLMELENTTLEIQMDTSRHMLTISEWDQEQTKQKEKQTEDNKELEKGESEKEAEEQSSHSDSSSEPPEVLHAKDELQQLMEEQKKASNLKLQLQEKLSLIQSKGRKLEELLPKRINNEDQKEILMLLCKVHELEIENTEMQSKTLLQENFLRQKDLVIARYEQHKNVADEIIRMQRELIEMHNLPVPLELEELYEVYTQDLDASFSHTQLHTLQSYQAKMSFLTQKLQDFEEYDDKLGTLDDEHSSPSPTKINSRNASTKDLSERDTPSKVFKASPQSRMLRQAANDNQVTLSPTHSDSVTKLESLVSISSRSNSRTSDSPEPPLGIVTSPDDIIEVAKKTKNINAIAARRRSRVSTHVPDVLTLDYGKTTASLNSLRDDTRQLKQIDEVRSNPLTPAMRHAVSEENLFDEKSSSKREESPPPVFVPRIAKPRRSDRKSLDRQARRRTKSHEVSEDKNKAGKVPAGTRQKTRSIRHSNGNYSDPARYGGRLKFPVNHHTGEGDLRTLEPVSTPPTTVFQSGADKGKGLSVQKRYRGPTYSDSSAASTPQLQPPPIRQKATIPAYRKANIAVAGHALPRSTDKHRRY